MAIVCWSVWRRILIMTYDMYYQQSILVVNVHLHNILCNTAPNPTIINIVDGIRWFMALEMWYIFDLDYNNKILHAQQQRPPVRQLSTRINTSAVYDNQLWMYENGFYYISTRYGCIGIVQSERMINAHMICTQKQMKDIRGMRIDKDRDDNCINYTPYISTEYSLHQLLTLLMWE